jgi:hypothetical protein
MTKYSQIAGNLVPYAGSHLGGTTVMPNGTAVTLTIPTDTSSIYFRAQAAAAYYQVGTGTATAGSASAMSYGYIPTDGVDFVFTCDNIGAVSVFTGTGGTVHLQYYSG